MVLFSIKNLSLYVKLTLINLRQKDTKKDKNKVVFDIHLKFKQHQL